MSPFELPANPDQVGMSEARLEETRNWIERQTGEGPYGCLIVRHGSIVAEWYGGSFSARSLFEIGSIRKSFNSALIGIGIQEGIVDLNARAADWWSDLLALSGDRADDAITLHQLASAVSGWLTPDSPGTVFRYSNAAFTAAERVVARMYGLPGDELAPEVVKRFKIPLGMHSWNVYHFAREFTSEPGNPGPKLAIDSNLRDLVKWGFLWLNRGVWDDEEVIPGDYVELATHQVNPDVPDAYYGYDWFVNAGQSLWPDAPQDAYGHPGNGTFKPSEKPSRTYLWICPSLDIVAAIVARVSAGFANDYLRVPQALTAEWIGWIVRSVARD
jgi:CubicO group peptidase (beta-lactamase class C family)